MIVSAVMTASASISQARKGLAVEVQKEMQQAVEAALADGLRPSEDASVIKERMLAARARVVEKWIGDGNAQ